MSRLSVRFVATSLAAVVLAAPSRGAARELAERARQAMHELQGRRAGAVLFDSVRTAVAPSWVDWGNPAVHRFVAAYTVGFRRY